MWFWAAYLMATHSNSISALQLRQSDRLGLLQDGLVALRQAARQRGALAYYVRNMVLDVRLPGLSGLDFQQELAREDIPIPIIFITGHGDIPLSVRAMKAGAVEFLTKLLRDQDLLDAIHAALRRDRSRLEEERKAADLRRRHESLRLASQVIALLVAGRVIKQIAAEIGISEVTVRLHRGQIMRKMRAGSLADLVRAADKIKI